MKENYHVVLTGKKPEADTAKVVFAMTKLFKISAERAQMLLTKQAVIKKNIDRDTADKYQKKLSSIGLNTIVKAIASLPNNDELTLSLENSKPPTAAADLQKQASEQSTNGAAGLSLFSETEPTAENEDKEVQSTQDSVNFSLVPETPTNDDKASVDNSKPLTLSDALHEADSSSADDIGGLSLVAEDTRDSSLATSSVESTNQKSQMIATDFSSLSLVEEPTASTTEDADLAVKPNNDALNEGSIDMQLSSELDLSEHAESANSPQTDPQAFTANDKAHAQELSSITTKDGAPASGQEDVELSTIEDEDYETELEPTNFLNRRLVDDITLLSIIVGIVTAMLGALVWRIIAVSFNVEIAWVAILIGGAIGVAVATSGGHGRSTGILCAVLAVVAIMLGKYWTVQGIMSNFMDEYKAVFRPEYVAMQEAANAYRSSMTDKEFVSFFQEFSDTVSDYSESEEVYDLLYDMNEASPEVIATVRAELEPEFDKIASMDFDTWYETEFLAQLEGVQDEMGFSAGDLVREDFDIIDVLFLLVGVAAAFKMGSGDD